MESDLLVSVIIPAYNASAFIAETIHSILNQTFSGWEVIIVNDGSTDETENIIRPLLNEKIKLINQINQGVSMARNNGLQQARGKYVVFLDADDVLSNEFLKMRINFLEANPHIDFCCSEVLHFNGNINYVSKCKLGACDNVAENILLYINGYDSVPSNYMCKKEILLKNNIRFNSLLSSTADRLFLLELDKYAKGGFVQNAPLYYRYHEDSMSNKFTIKLVNDNVLFYRLVEENKLIPNEIKNQVSFLKYYIIATSYLKIKHLSALNWYLIGFLKHPFKFIKKLFHVI